MSDNFFFDCEVDGTSCCAIAVISNEGFHNGNQSISSFQTFETIKDKDLAVKLIRQYIDKNIVGDCSTLITTVNNKNRKWWLEVWRLAGFKQFGATKVNPNSGNRVTKLYLDIDDKFKP